MVKEFIKSYGVDTVSKKVTDLSPWENENI